MWCQWLNTLVCLSTKGAIWFEPAWIGSCLTQFQFHHRNYCHTLSSKVHWPIWPDEYNLPNNSLFVGQHCFLKKLKNISWACYIKKKIKLHAGSSSNCLKNLDIIHCNWNLGQIDSQIYFLVYTRLQVISVDSLKFQT